jgi:hypothetical protein
MERYDMMFKKIRAAKDRFDAIGNKITTLTEDIRVLRHAQEVDSPIISSVDAVTDALLYTSGELKNTHVFASLYGLSPDRVLELGELCCSP